MLRSGVSSALALFLVAAPASALQWQKTSGPSGAWVVGLDQASDHTVWLAARGGGVYSSLDGAPWTLRNAGLTRFDLMDLAVAADGTPVLVTPTAILRRVSGSWSASSTGIPFGTNSNVQATSILRAANGHLFVVANSVYRSTNHGASWTEATSGLAGTVVNGTRLVQSRQTAQDSSGNLYLSTTDAANRLFVSTDGGNNWTKRETGLGAGFMLSLAAGGPGTMLAFTTNGEVYSTANAGESWSKLANVFSAVPNDVHSTVVVNGVAYAGQGNNVNISASLRRSANGGSTWASVTSFRAAGAILNQQGAAMPVIRVLHDGRLVAGFSGAGVFTSSDGLAWTAMNAGLDAGVVNTVYGAPGSLLAAGRGVGNHCTTDGGGEWVATSFTLQSADVTQYIKPSNAARIVATNIIRDAFQSNVYQSLDGGATWSVLANSQQPAVTRLFEHGGVLYSAAAGTNNSAINFMQSTNGGQNWSGLGAPPGTGNDIAADAAGALYIVSDIGLYRRAAGTTTWTRFDNIAGNGLPTPAIWGSVIGDAGGNVYLVTLSSPGGQPGVYVSTNGGTSWTRKSSGLPAEQISLGLANLRFEKGPDGAIYLVSKHAGLFRTTNGGTTWTDENGNLPIPAADPAGRRGLLALGFAADGTPFVGLEGAGVYVAGALGDGSSFSGVNCAKATGPDLELDAGFGDQGLSKFTSALLGPADAVVDAGGGLTMAGHGSGLMGLRLSRLTPEGAFDTEYGDAGFVDVLQDGRVNRISMALQADGKVVVATGVERSSVSQCTVVRLNADGSLDGSFGGDGIADVPTSIETQSDCAHVAVASDGDIVAGGNSIAAGFTTAPLALFRFNANGALDNAFGGDGVYEYPDAFGEVEGLVEAGGGAVIAIGNARTESTSQRALGLKVTSAGALDAGFGTGGEIALGEPYAQSLARHSSGRFAVANQLDDEVRVFTAAGAPFTDFGGDGVATVASPRQVAFRADGSVILSGQNDGFHVFLAPPDTTRRPCANGSGYNGMTLDALGRALLFGTCSNPSGQTSYVLRTRVLPPDSTGGGGDDSTPNPYSFASQGNVAVGTPVTSAPATITGIDTVAPVTVTNGTYSVGCTGSFTGAAGGIVNGQTLCLRHTAAATPKTSVSTMVSVGGVLATFTSTTAEGPDTTPNAFSLADRTGVATGTAFFSNLVTVGGINAPASLTLGGNAGGRAYSLNDGPYVTGATTVSSGDTVRVRLTSSGAANTAVTAVLNIGGVSDTWTVTTGATDTTPATFNFADRVDMPTYKYVFSNLVTIGGLGSPQPITLPSGPPARKYSLNGGDFTAEPGTVTNGDTVRLQMRTSASPDVTLTTKVTIGTFTDAWSVTTGAMDTTPAAFSFPDVTGAPRATEITSAPVTPTGYNAAVPISIAGTASRLYSINGGPFVSTAGTLEPGDSVRVRLTSGNAANRTLKVTVTIGGISNIWTVRTAP